MTSTGLKSVWYSHILTVLNHPPSFTTTLSATTFNIMVNSPAQTLSLPSYSLDADDHVVTMTYSTLPAYAGYNLATKTFTFSPVATAHIGT